jgi:acid phosphatase type 7
MKTLLASLVLGSSVVGAGVVYALHTPLAQTLSQTSSAQPAKQPVKTQATDPVIAAAGDIACQPDTSSTSGSADETCQMKATSDLLLNQKLTAVLPLGDLQYEKGEADGFLRSYDPTWGRLKDISYPVVGNHEYYTKDAAPYYQYFGKAAGEPTKGYYSYNIGSWHIIALNSNCEEVGGCQAGSPQEQWLQQDLAKHTNACTLAYWHHPRFSSGAHGNNEDLDAFWQALYQADAEVILNGHDHHYERFAPQTPAAELDVKRGIREFVIGTGGKSLRPTLLEQNNSEMRNAQAFGVLKLTLHSNGYSWKFEPIAGQTFTDAGQESCH